MSRILLAFDGSDGAVGTVTALSHWSLHRSAEVHVLTVTLTGEWPSAHVSRMRELVARSLRRRGATVHLMLREGDPAEEILTAAQALDADLIALGPRKRMGLSALFLGSVTRAILHRCGCSVFVGRLSLGTERAIMVLTDAADLALLAGRWQELPLPEAMELILLAIGSDYPVPCHEPPGSLRHGSPEKLLGLAQAEERDHLWALVETGRQVMRSVASNLMAEVALGNQVAEVLRLERRVAPELLVVRNTGHQDQLVTEARSSVLLLR